MTPLTSPIDFTPEPPPLPQPRFRLAPVALIVLALCGSLHLLCSLPRWQVSPPLIAQDLGVFTMGFLISMGLAWLAWRLDPRRKAGSFVFCFLMLLFTTSQVLPILTAIAHASQRSQVPPVARRQLVPAPGQPTAQSDAAPAKAPPATHEPSLVERGIGFIQQAESDARGDTQKMKAVCDRVGADFQAKLEAYNRATAELKAAGYADAAGLNSLEAITHRRVLIKKCADTNADLTQTCQTMEPRLHAELLRVVPELEAQRCTAAVIDRLDLPLVLRIRNDEQRLATAFDGLLAQYQAAFPHWHLNAEHRVVFDDVTVVPRQQYWAKQIMALANEEHGVQQELVARRKARLAQQEAPASQTTAN